MARTFFKEEQRFNQPWIWAILLMVTGFWLWWFIQQIILGKPFGDNPAPDFVVFIFMIFPLGTILLFRYMILETLIDDAGVHYRFRLFQRKFRTIKPEDILSVEVKPYHPIRDYGGWGIRLGSTGKGTAYNVRGNMGVLFELKNGKKFLLGTQQPQAIKSAMAKLMSKDRDF